ncbi:hypothetical protein [Neisseria perflava]|uniref:hypothetical protein n=1 Tax=Neisseria perflava TaxID=33053 RepID=UPI00209F6DB4|nr:hypothetical protein [Neisseria perflava]MCP1659808.1 hypothetical protein [Neisseria perflava]MCP1773392.1 hypothetical protein [Neisseria perflava]
MKHQICLTVLTTALFAAPLAHAEPPSGSEPFQVAPVSLSDTDTAHMLAANDTSLSKKNV